MLEHVVFSENRLLLVSGDLPTAIIYSLSSARCYSFLTMAPSAMTNYAEIQEDEIQALRSIYMDDFQEERPKVGAWNVCNNIFLGII